MKQIDRKIKYWKGFKRKADCLKSHKFLIDGFIEDLEALKGEEEEMNKPNIFIWMTPKCEKCGSTNVLFTPCHVWQLCSDCWHDTRKLNVEIWYSAWNYVLKGEETVPWCPECWAKKWCACAVAKLSE